MEKRQVHVFDVDGTLTHHDSLLLLFRFLKPSLEKRCLIFLTAALKLTPYLLIGQRWKLKQSLLSKLWAGKQHQDIDNDCTRFFEEILIHDLRKNALEYIETLRQKSPSVQIVLLSASCKEWLQPLATNLQADLICTELAFDEENRFTGRFATPNCKGPEKVRRLLEQYPKEQYRFICYADAASDKPLQTISEQFFYRYF